MQHQGVKAGGLETLVWGEHLCQQDQRGELQPDFFLYFHAVDS